MKGALLVGINYTGSSSELNGCINDVNNVKKLLLSKGYEEDNITILTDETNIKPTRNNIISELLKLILSGAKQIFFHYSGHGSSVVDIDGDESDGRDETLVPIDYETNGLIIDDEIRGILQCLNYGQCMFCLIDACHSGTSIDLKYNLYERASTGTMVMMRDRLTERKNKELRGKCIMLSGCMDNQTSADAYIMSAAASAAASSSAAANNTTGSFQGAMTHAFLTAMDYSHSYKELVINSRKALKNGGYAQLPNISASYNLDLNNAIII